MGNSYTHLATYDPSELNGSSSLSASHHNLASSLALHGGGEGATERLSKWAKRLSSGGAEQPHQRQSSSSAGTFAAGPVAHLRMHRSSTNYMDKHPIVRNPVHSDAVGALAPVRPGMVISGSRDKVIALNNIDTGECVLRWYGHEKEVTKLVYRNAGGKHYILSGSRDTTLKLWQFNSPQTLHTFTGHEMSITGLAMLDERRCISGARDATLRVWDICTGVNTRTVQHSRNLVTHLSLCHSNGLIAQSSEDKELKIWDSRDLSLVHQFPKKQHILTHCDFLPDGNYCLTSSNGFNGDGCEITMWDLRQHKIVREYRGHEESVTCAVYLPQQVTWKRLMLSVSADHCARIWNADDGNCLWNEIVPVGVDLLACVGFNDGNIVVSGLNASLCHLRLLGKAGRPYLHCVSVQTNSIHSGSLYRVRD